MTVLELLLPGQDESSDRAPQQAKGTLARLRRAFSARSTAR